MGSLLLLAAVKPAAYLSARRVYLAVEANPTIVPEHDGTCGGFVYDTHVFGTAAHCFFAVSPILSEPVTRPPLVGEKVWLNGREYTLLEWVDDGNDHILARVDGPPFSLRARFADQAWPDIGTDIFFWGIPQGMVAPMLRKGIVGGSDSLSDVEDAPKNKLRWLDTTGGPGDSGSPVFNDQGRVVGIVSQGIGAYGFLGLYPLAFTPEQLEDIRQ